MTLHAIPTATYRLQLTADFPFDAASAVLPQLKQLGISHVYASPFLQARRGSTHGYDIIDHTRINPELGGEEAFERFVGALRANGLGLILDFVPNHMGIHHADNGLWLDVLEWGSKSRFASWFDIEWDILPHRKRPGLLLPILGGTYGETLERGDIKLTYDGNDGSFSAWYFEHRLPINPTRYLDILRTIVAATAQRDTAGSIEALRGLASEFSARKLNDQSTANDFKARLRAIPHAQSLIDDGLQAYRAGPDRPQETAALHLLLERQHYRLAHWQLAASDINYRRFFDINSLAGLAAENRQTFEHSHSLIRQLIRQDKIQGLRLDHIDGLRDPAQYFLRLNRLIAEERPSGSAKRFYVVIEKILGEGEQLRKFASVHGTTGYEWLNVITQVLIKPAGLRMLTDTWRQAANSITPFSATVRQAKRRVLQTLLASEFTVLVRLLSRIAAGHYSTRDFSEDGIRQALELFVVEFPVYRTYITSRGPNDAERETIAQTIDHARQNWFGADNGIFDFLRDVLTLDLVKPRNTHHSRVRALRFTLKLQQFTGPLMAKGLEDTAFYRYHRLLALNEVGGNPSSSGLPVHAFHQLMQDRAARWPNGLTSTSTHDTKRGEDARARLIGISEIANEWEHHVGQWKVMNAGFIRTDGNRRTPSVADEYMIYQSIVGALPIGNADEHFVERMQQFALKAIREAKVQTSWLNPNQWYEDGVMHFIKRILDPATGPDFVPSIVALTERLALLGALNSLSQLTLKATMPGVPDFYQGTELWDLSLVDPDNRRPVDMETRRNEIAAAAHGSDWAMLSSNWRDGRIKLHWTRYLLALRNSSSALTTGNYTPVETQGADADRVIAFARATNDTSAIVVALRHMGDISDFGRRWPNFGNVDARIKVPRTLDIPSKFKSDHTGYIEVPSILASLPANVLILPLRRRNTS